MDASRVGFEGSMLFVTHDPVIQQFQFLRAGVCRQAKAVPFWILQTAELDVLVLQISERLQEIFEV